MFKKGISPLIAAVILIAFVIAVAGIASTFFTGFTKQQAAGVTTKAGTVIDCAVAVLELDSDFVTFTNATGNSGKIEDILNPDNATLVISNKGQTKLENLQIIIYSEIGVESCPSTPDSVNIAEVKSVTSEGIACVPTGTLTKIRITTEDCPGVGSTLKYESVAGTLTWVLTE